MNVENPAIANLKTLSAETPETLTPQQSSEIIALPLDSFRLIGGGQGIVVL